MPDLRGAFDSLCQSEAKAGCLDQITIYNLDKITAVGKGELIQPELQALLQELPFLPKKFQGEYALPLQEEIWEFLRKLQEEEQENILIANSRLTRLENRQEFSVPWHRGA